MNSVCGYQIASARHHHTRLAIDFHCHRTLKNEDLHPVAVLVLLDERAGREAVKGGVYAILALEDRRFVKRNAAYARRSEEHKSELQSLMRISYAVFCLKKNNNTMFSNQNTNNPYRQIKQHYISFCTIINIYLTHISH